MKRDSSLSNSQEPTTEAILMLLNPVHSLALYAIVWSNSNKVKALTRVSVKFTFSLNKICKASFEIKLFFALSYEILNLLGKIYESSLRKPYNVISSI